MKRCKLTQVPCRKAIVETINANKSRYSLQYTYEMAKLFQLAELEHPDFDEKDWKKYFIIRDILRMDDLKTLQCVSYFINAFIRQKRC